MLSYEDALIRTGLETLATRGHISCTKFINRLKNETEEYNPLACIVRKVPQAIDNKYYLKTPSVNKFITNTERFANFVTIKYAYRYRFLYL